MKCPDKPIRVHLTEEQVRKLSEQEQLIGLDRPVARMKQIFEAIKPVIYYPEEMWVEQARNLCVEIFRSPPPDEEIAVSSHPLLKMLRRTLILAVDPENKHDPTLAAPVAAVRLTEEQGIGLAAPLPAYRLLLRTFMESLGQAGSGTIQEIADLFAAPLGTSSKYQVWKAIIYLIKESMKEIDDECLDGNRDDDTPYIFTIPDTSKVREFTRDNQDYPALMNVDQNRWTDIWKEPLESRWLDRNKGGRPRSQDRR